MYANAKPVHATFYKHTSIVNHDGLAKLRGYKSEWYLVVWLKHSNQLNTPHLAPPHLTLAAKNTKGPL